jgi:PadR family transcriptional regulator, regulatory protein PadR
MVEMPKGDYPGEFEQIMLLALLRLGDSAYGMAIRREILDRTGRDVSIGAVYATLDRLEEKGFVSSRQGDPSPERGGRAKRFFKIEADGEAALRESHRVLTRMTQGLKPKWGVI